MAFPYLSDLIKYLTGFEIWLPIPTFGLMLALSILTAIYFTSLETKRLFQEGWIGMARRKVRNKDGKRVFQEVPPDTLISELGMYCAIAGVLGARVFHILEYPEQFLADPIGMIFSRGGLTIYGGLIFGAITGGWFVKHHNLDVRPMADAAAPSMMIAYAVGRIGCQLAGDGDWGIAANIATKPDWLPTWLWAQTYQGNILGKTIAVPGVYPTPMYETLACTLLFGILWLLRKHPFQFGWLFSVYMILNGIERFVIEKIRVNIEFTFLGIRATQAEIIAIVVFWFGLLGVVIFSKRRKHPEKRPCFVK